MAAPLLDSTPAGLRVLADVAEILAGGLATEDAVAQVMQVLRRSLRWPPGGSGSAPPTARGTCRSVHLGTTPVPAPSSPSARTGTAGAPTGTRPPRGRCCGSPSSMQIKDSGPS